MHCVTQQCHSAGRNSDENSSEFRDGRGASGLGDPLQRRSSARRSCGCAGGKRAGDQAAMPRGRACPFAAGPRTIPSFLPPSSPLLPAPALSSACLSPVFPLLFPVLRCRHLSQPTPVLSPEGRHASRRAVCLCCAGWRGVVQWLGDVLLG